MQYLSVNQQYNVIYHYDATISAKSSEITSQIHSLKGVKEVYEEDHLAVTTKIDNKDISTTVHVISNDDKFKDFYTLFNGNKEFDIDDSSVLISQKMAAKLNKKAGDMITFKDANNKIIKAKIKVYLQIMLVIICMSAKLCMIVGIPRRRHRTLT